MFKISTFYEWKDKNIICLFIQRSSLEQTQGVLSIRISTLLTEIILRKNMGLTIQNIFNWQGKIVHKGKFKLTKGNSKLR